jgi:hypothetical protein
VTTGRIPITEAGTSWWSTSRRRIFYDSHTPDWTDPHQRGNIPNPDFPLLSQARPEHDLEVMATAGVDSVVLFAKCQYGNAYYPTEVGRAHSALQGRDLFGEQLRAAHSRGIRVIAYFSNMWDTAAAGAHPQWRLVASPARGSTGRWPALCLLSDYRRYALDQVREIASRYPIDGLWSDILTAGPCVCPRCEAAFEERYGRSMPSSPEEKGWLDLIHFSQDVLYDYLSEQRAVLKEARPKAALIPNFYATTFVDAVLGLSTRHLRLADIGSSEGYTDWHGLRFPSFAASYVRAAIDDGPSEVLVGRFVHTWDFTLRSSAQLRYEAFSVAAHGSAVTIDDQPYATGAIEPEVYERLRPVFTRIAERAQWLEGTRPEPYAGLYASQTSRELESLLGGPENPSHGEQSAQFPPSEPRSTPSDLVAALTGSYLALVESHIPVELIDERARRLGRLGGLGGLGGLASYRVLVLPDVLALSAGEVAAVERFVRAGGGLVVTGPTAVRDIEGTPLTSSPLEDLLGVRFGDRGRFSYPYLKLTSLSLADRLGTRPIPHYGPMVTLELLDADIRVLATRIDPVLETDDRSYWHNNQPAPGAETGKPVIVERRVGQGRVIVSAARLGNNRARLGDGTYRDLIDALVRRAAGADPAVRVQGSHRNTELVLARRGPDLIAHLVTGHPVLSLDVYGAHQPAAIEDVNHEVSVVLRLPPGTTSVARVVDAGEVNVPIRPDHTIELVAPDDWETLVLRTPVDNAPQLPVPTNEAASPDQRSRRTPLCISDQVAHIGAPRSAPWPACRSRWRPSSPPALRAAHPPAARAPRRRPAPPSVPPR